MKNEGNTAVVNRKKKLWWQVPLLLFLVLGTLYIAFKRQTAPYYMDSGLIFGTVYNITYQNENNLKDSIEAELKRIDQEFSMFNSQSTVSMVNRGEAAVLSDRFLEVYDLAATIYGETSGAFDITVAPLVNAWGFGFKHEQLPTDQQVDSLREFIGMHHIELDRKGRSLSKDDARVMLDFSAIAKGYGADCVARVLARNGVRNYMVEIGGEVVMRGKSPHSTPWHIGVTKPTEDSLQTSQELQTVLNVTNCALATSGNYRNFYYNGGRKYAHTIDPQTGYPVQHSLLSATVLAENCATADAYATAFMVLGMERAKEVLSRHPELQAYFIYSDEQGNYAVWSSPKLEKNIVR